MQRHYRFARSPSAVSLRSPVRRFSSANRNYAARDVRGAAAESLLGPGPNSNPNIEHETKYNIERPTSNEDFLEQQVRDVMQEECVDYFKLGSLVNSGYDPTEEDLKNLAQNPSASFISLTDELTRSGAFTFQQNQLLNALSIGIDLRLQAMKKSFHDEMDTLRAEVNHLRKENIRLLRGRDEQYEDYEVDVNALLHDFVIPEISPFKAVSLNQICSEWFSRSTNPNVRLAELFRFILPRITENPEDITMFTYRTSSRGNHRSDLKDLPEEVIKVLIEFSVESCGFSQQELKENWSLRKLESSSWFNSLGSTPRERQQIYTEYREKYNKWLLMVKDALQRTLSDTRRCNFEGPLPANGANWWGRAPNGKKTKSVKRIPDYSPERKRFNAS